MSGLRRSDCILGSALPILWRGRKRGRKRERKAGKGQDVKGRKGGRRRRRRRKKNMSEEEWRVCRACCLAV